MAIERTKARIEQMRQISRPIAVIELEASLASVWLVRDIESQITMGVYRDEDKASAASEEIFSLYQIDTEIEEVKIDGLFWDRV